MPTDEELHWTRVPPLRPPSRGRPPLRFRPTRPPPTAQQARQQRILAAILGSLVFHILLLWGVGRMVPQLNMRLIPDTPSVQLTLIEPPEPVVIPQPLELRRLDTPAVVTPPITVPIVTPETPQVETPKVEAPKAPPRPVLKTPTQKLVAPPTVAAPTIQRPTLVPTLVPSITPDIPAPAAAIPKIIKAPPSTLEDLDLHKTPPPPKALIPKLTLPAPPGFGTPEAPGSAAPGGGTPGSAAPGGGGGGASAGTGTNFIYGNGKGMDCSKAAQALMSNADQEKCKIMAALAAAAALKKMQAADRNANPLDSLGDKRTGFAEERAARAERAAKAGELLGRITRGSGPTAPSPSTVSGPVR